MLIAVSHQKTLKAAPPLVITELALSWKVESASKLSIPHWETRIGAFEVRTERSSVERGRFVFGSWNAKLLCPSLAAISCLSSEKVVEGDNLKQPAGRELNTLTWTSSSVVAA